MNNGGIFGGPTALGYLGLGQSGGAKPCQGVSFFKELQAELRRRGYGVRQDGIWDGCCQSALIKETGAPMVTIAQVQQFLGRPCRSGYMDPGGFLIGSPTQATIPSCSDGSDRKGSTPGQIPGCEQGQIYDVSLQKCVPTADPYKCGQTCSGFQAMTASWAQCLLECNLAGASLPVPPGPVPPEPPEPIVTVDPVEPSAKDVFGGYLPHIVGALAVGVTAAVYFGTKKKKPPTRALMNRRKRSRKKRSKGRR